MSLKLIRPVAVTDAVFTSSTISEADYSAWSSGTTYALGAYCINTTTHKIYISLQATNLNHDPTLTASSAWWSVVSATNKWKMFDTSTGTQTTATTSFTVVMTPGSIVNTIAFLNVTAANVVITMTDPIAGVVFTQTYYTAQGTLTGSWDSYLWDYVKAKTSFYIEGLPSYVNATVKVQFNNTGTVACGVMSFGRSIVLGDTQLGSHFGIIDYSTKTTDAAGGYTLTQGNFSRKASFSVWVDNGILDTVSQVLTDFRATPATWIGTSTYQGTFIYGFLRDWSVTLSQPTASVLDITIEGLS